MRTLSLLNLKGGVGKTVSTVGLATALAELDRGRVVIVDADPQGGLTRWVTGHHHKSFQKRNLKSLLEGHHDLEETLIELEDTSLHTDDPSRARAWSGISLIPTSTKRVTVDATFGGDIDYLSLRTVLQRDTPEDVAFCLIDVGHGDNDSTRLGVAASDMALTVVAAWQVQSVQQISGVMDMVAGMREAFDHVHLGGVIVTGYNYGYATQRSMIHSLRERLGDQLWSVIPSRADVERAINWNKPLTHMPSRINPIPDNYRELAKRVDS